MKERAIIKKVRELMKEKRVSLTKLGTVLGSKGCQQARIDRANRFIHGYQKSVSMLEVQKLAKFFGKPQSYFFVQTPSLREYINSYGKLNPTGINKLPKREVDEILGEIKIKHPAIIGDISLEGLSETAKRIILKAFYFKGE